MHTPVTRLPRPFYRLFFEISLLHLCLLLLPSLWMLFVYPSAFLPSLHTLSPTLVAIASATMVGLTQCLLLFVLLLSRYLRWILIPLWFLLGSIAVYYLCTYHQSVNAGIIANIYEVESELIREFISLRLMLWCSAIQALVCWRLYHYRHAACPELLDHPPRFLAVFLILLEIGAILDWTYGERRSFMIGLNYYPPLNIGMAFAEDWYEFRWVKHLQDQKRDLTQLYDFSWTPSNTPPVIVLVIGESARGDMLGVNGYDVDTTPRLSKEKGIVSHRHATACASTTREAVPCMLSRATSANWQESMEESSIISIFQHLGFETAWLGLQGDSGAHEATYGSITLEANKRLVRHDLQQILGHDRLYDAEILPFVEEQLHKSRHQPLLMIVHLYGSHWHYEWRYPREFEHFTPICTSNEPRICPPESLRNSYHNTLRYTDHVLAEIIALLRKKNAILLYASDHAVSLGEKDRYGSGQGLEDALEQYHIPMIWWASNSFQRHFPSVLKKLTHYKEKPVSHNHIFHSLLGCIGVKSSAIEAEWNLCR